MTRDSCENIIPSHTQKPTWRVPISYRRAPFPQQCRQQTGCSILSHEDTSANQPSPGQYWTALDSTGQLSQNPSSPNKVPNWLALDRLFQYLSQVVPAVLDCPKLFHKYLYKPTVLIFLLPVLSFQHLNSLNVEVNQFILIVYSTKNKYYILMVVVEVEAIVVVTGGGHVVAGDGVAINASGGWVVIPSSMQAGGGVVVIVIIDGGGPIDSCHRQ